MRASLKKTQSNVNLRDYLAEEEERLAGLLSDMEEVSAMDEPAFQRAL